jgi:hypothetical protein
MENTRASIRDTVEEIKDRVGETVDWQHYIRNYPGTSLSVAAALGLLIGRGVGVMIHGRREQGAEPAGFGDHRAAETYGEAALASAAHAGSPRPLTGPRRAVSESWSRLGSRVESIANRVIDELTDAVETTLVPAVSSWVRNRLDFGSAGEGRQGWVGGGEDRLGKSGVHAGGPAGRQHYPTQGRTAEQG